MTSTNNYSTVKQLLILFLVFAGLYFARNFLIPISIAAVLATLFLPFCTWLEKHKVPKALAAFLCLLTLVLVLAAIASLIVWQVFELTKDIELIKQRSVQIIANIQNYIFYHLGISIEEQSVILSREKPFISDILQKIAGSLSVIFTYLILILIYVLFLLYYRGHIRRAFLKLFPPAQQAEMDKLIYSVAKVSQQYLLGLSKMIGLLWLMYGIGFSVIGVKNALFFAILCGVLEIVPYIGNLTGTSITVLVTAVQGGSPTMLLGILLTYGMIQFIQGWVLEPLILGPQVKINPLFTIIALVVGELVWGIPGIFLAIPLIAMFKIVCDHVDSLKALGFLIGETETVKKDLNLPRKILGLYKKKDQK